jgi:hypothetical protein
MVAAGHPVGGQTGKNCNTFYSSGNYPKVREYLAGQENPGHTGTVAAIPFYLPGPAAGIWYTTSPGAMLSTAHPGSRLA